MSDYIKRQHDLRQAAWHEAKQILETASAESRDLTAEEDASYARISEDLDTRAKVIEQLVADEERAQRLDAAAVEARGDAVPVDESDVAAIRQLASGEIRSYSFEQRDVLTSSTGAPVPTSFHDRVITKARLVGPMLATSTILQTAGGENIQIPNQNARSTAAITAQGQGISESDPTFNSFVTLGAFKYGFLISVSAELLTDSGVDLLGFIADNVGNAVGFKVNNDLTLGTGTVEPNGLVAQAGSGITGATATSGVFTADNLIDLTYSLDGAARFMPGFGYMANGASIGAMRKLKDTAGNYVFSPSLGVDARDMLMNRPVYENPAMASAGTGVKSVVCGDFSSYYVRQVGGIRLDRSDDYAFNTDLVTFRASLRVDGALVQTSHVKYFIGGVS